MHKHPAFRGTIIAVVVCIAAAVCLQTNPYDRRASPDSPDSLYGAVTTPGTSDIPGTSDASDALVLLHDILIITTDKPEVDPSTDYTKESFSEGAAILVRKMSKSGYCCTIFPAESRKWSEKPIPEVRSYSLEQMGGLIKKYEIPSDKITLTPAANAYSSYVWVDRLDDAAEAAEIFRRLGIDNAEIYLPTDK